MEDQDLKELFHQIGIWLFIVVVFGGMFTYILVTKFGSQDISINKIIDKKDNVTILVVSKDVKNIQELKYTLNTYGVNYELVYKDRERYYDDFLNKMDLMDKEVIPPTIIYVENKQIKGILSDIKDLDELKNFIEYNNLSGKE